MLEKIQNHSLYTQQNDIHPRIHAKLLDKKLGYRTQRIENKLVQKYRAYDKPEDSSSKKQHFKGAQTWIGLHPQALQTTYNDIFHTMVKLKDQNVESIIDIGAGYGRVGVVMNAIFPAATFTGYEILSARTNEGNRIFDKLGLKNCELILQDVLEDNFQMPEAQIYFIYDFSEVEDISKILDVLSSKANKNNFYLITNGDRIDYLIKRRYKQFWNSNGFLKNGELTIYSSNKKPIGE